jgi:hypothetical protein
MGGLLYEAAIPFQLGHIFAQCLPRRMRPRHQRTHPPRIVSRWVGVALGTQVGRADDAKQNSKNTNNLLALANGMDRIRASNHRASALAMESTMQAITLRDVKPGEFVRRKPDAKKTYVKEAYDRTTKTFCLQDFDDISRQVYVKGDKLVWIGFDF